MGQRGSNYPVEHLLVVTTPRRRVVKSQQPGSVIECTHPFVVVKTERSKEVVVRGSNTVTTKVSASKNELVHKVRLVHGERLGNHSAWHSRGRETSYVGVKRSRTRPLRLPMLIPMTWTRSCVPFQGCSLMREAASSAMSCMEKGAFFGAELSPIPRLSNTRTGRVSAMASANPRQSFHPSLI